MILEGQPLDHRASISPQPPPPVRRPRPSTASPRLRTLLLPLLVPAILCPHAALAQSGFEGFDNSQFMVIEEGGEEEGTGLSYWDRHFSGSIVGYFSSGIDNDDNQRYNIQGRLRFDEEIEHYKFVVETRAYYSDVNVAFARERRNLNDGSTTELEPFRLNSSDDRIEFLQAYVDVDLDTAELSFGRKKVLFGQFDVFSPVDFFLPIDFSGSTLSLNRVDNRLPQWLASANFYLPNSTELSYYYFPRLTLDAFSRDLQSGIPYDDENFGRRTVPFSSPKDEAQHALRLLQTGSDLIWGLTYYRGFQQFPAERARIARSGDGRLLCRVLPGGRDRGGPVTSQEQCYRRRGGEDSDAPGELFGVPAPQLEPREALGFEMALPLDKFTLKFEVTVEEAIEEFGSDIPRDPDGEPSRAGRRFLDWVIGENDGRFWIRGDLIGLGAGLDYDSDDWLFNFNLLYYPSLYDEASQRGRDLAVRAELADPFGERRVLPTINVLRRFGDDREQSLGFAAGLIGFAAGFTFYYLDDSIENFQYGFSLDGLIYISNVQFLDDADEAEEDPLVESSLDVEDLSLSLRAYLRYSF